jgi:hypothetical protein
MDNYRTPLAESRDDRGRGHGSFVSAFIPRLTAIATFGGLASDFTGLSAHPAERVARSIQIEVDRFLVGPERREPGDSINHSCAPNCGMRNATQVVAMRDIAVGEELTFDYAMTDMAPYDEFDCSCGTPECRGRVTAEDWQREDLRHRYAGWFAPHVQRAIDASRSARPLKKREAEELLGSFDTDPIGALTRSLRIATGRPHATWEHLLALFPRWRRDLLLSGDAAALDSLAAEMNETRTVPSN